jgi:hypothetical protein
MHADLHEEGQKAAPLVFERRRASRKLNQIDSSPSCEGRSSSRTVASRAPDQPRSAAPFVRITSAYQAAESFGVRLPVA